ncbi:MAG: type II secretion system GspH family protein [Gammaproteobacteria bacterium]|nr:type II secretion system GspH family protein [Gammaproteobacteria bacterium]
MHFEYFRYNKNIRGNGGFTLVELITVILILGVMAVVGASKFFSQSSFTDAQYHQEILSAFRFAQKIAIASQCDVVITLGTNSYSLTYSGSSSGVSCSGNVAHPADQSSYSATNTSTINPAVTYTYNASGVVSPTSSFTVGGRNITVEPVTGYVHE